MQNSYIFIQENAFEYVIYQMVSILASMCKFIRDSLGKVTLEAIVKIHQHDTTTGYNKPWAYFWGYTVQWILFDKMLYTISDIELCGDMITNMSEIFQKFAFDYRVRILMSEGDNLSLLDSKSLPCAMYDSNETMKMKMATRIWQT